MVRTILFEFINMVNNINKKPHAAEPSAAVHAAAGDALLSLAADTSSVAASYSPAIVADARGYSPREADSSLVVDYECESADSGRLEQSPDRHRATDSEPLTEKVQSNRRVTSLFGSSNENERASIANQIPKTLIRIF